MQIEARQLDEVMISKAIIDRYMKELMAATDVDVAIAGAGPAGVTAAYYLAKAGYRVVIFEAKLAPGGGMWGGGMFFNTIVVQEAGLPILDEFGVRYQKYHENYYTADSIETVAKLLSKAISSGVKVFNVISVDDTMIIDNKVCGFVINWTPVNTTNLHVDPLTIRSKYAIEATGHPLEVLQKLVSKKGKYLNTKDGDIQWEEPMDATLGEHLVVENTKEVYPGIFVAGMAANAVYGSPRMGPVFGGMLLSGKKVAEHIIEKLKKGE
jgi:thiamine thiazole synthase